MFLKKEEYAMNIDYDKLYCYVDDFCKGFEKWYKKTLITSGNVTEHVK